MKASIGLCGAFALAFLVCGFTATAKEGTAAKKDAPAACAEKKADHHKARHAKEEKVAQAQPQTEVWWGNGAVSFRNYIKFDRTEIARPAEKPYPPFNPIYFDLDKAVLRPDGIVIANQVVDYMKSFPDKKVVIEGHCCDLATNEYNMGLGQRRADAVKKYLVENGIGDSRIQTVSFGEEKRATTAPEERPLNRRAIVVVRFAE